MMFAAVLISGRQWWPWAVIFLLAAIFLLGWTYHRAPAAKTFCAACAFLKLLGLGALLACLLEPLWIGQRARPGANFFAVIADNSESMRIRDHGELLSRGGALSNLLAPRNAGWLAQLEKDFQLRRYYFDSRLQSTRDFSELTFDGRASAMGAALRTVGERFHGQPLAGVLLLTDGNAMDLTAANSDLSGLPPVYPVVIGSDKAIKDIAIHQTTVSQSAFEDTPVTIQADAVADGYAGKTIVAQLFGPDGKVAQEQSQRAVRDGETMAFRFQFRPDKPGVSFYRVRVSAKDELGQFEKPESSTEATLANNSRTLVVDRGKGPHRILYVSGRPNWEYKFLNRALAADDQLELVGLIRVARREPKFDFRGRVGESSNPLYRGFGQQTEDTESYDQPVLERMNTKDAAELAGGFPRTADVLYAYDAVIVGDLEADFFSRDQMALLQKFVSERGGGFLMLGGAESFHQGNYEHTPIGEMLPVYLDYPLDAAPLTNFQLNLTREGLLQPWARLRSTETEEQSRLGQMPALQVLNAVREVKPGASIIAETRDESGQARPAIVTQRFGNGRAGAVLVGDLWRWGMRDEANHRDLDKAWRQMARWLIADVPARIEFHAEPKPDDPNQAVLLQVRARDKEFLPLDNASVKITVTPVPDSAQPTGTNSVHLNAEPALIEAGVYEAEYVPRLSGGYLAEAVVTDAAGVEAGRAQTGWSADPAAEEFRSLKPNRALLENIARQTGGEVIAAKDLDAFARQLPTRKAPVTERWSFPLWHQPVVFLFALACFLTEWGLRRWKGLA